MNSWTRWQYFNLITFLNYTISEIKVVMWILYQSGDNTSHFPRNLFKMAPRTFLLRPQVTSSKAPNGVLNCHSLARRKVSLCGLVHLWKVCYFSILKWIKCSVIRSLVEDMMAEESKQIHVPILKVTQAMWTLSCAHYVRRYLMTLQVKNIVCITSSFIYSLFTARLYKFL